MSDSQKVISPPDFGGSLKTGFLVSAFRDSDDMEGKKFKTDSQYIVTFLVELCLRHRYETVMVERS